MSSAKETLSAAAQENFNEHNEARALSDIKKMQDDAKAKVSCLFLLLRRFCRRLLFRFPCFLPPARCCSEEWIWMTNRCQNISLPKKQAHGGNHALHLDLLPLMHHHQIAAKDEFGVVFDKERASRYSNAALELAIPQLSSKDWRTRKVAAYDFMDEV